MKEVKYNYIGALFTFLGDNGKKYNVTITTPKDSGVLDKNHSISVYEDGKVIYTERRSSGHANKSMALLALKRRNK